MSFTVLCLTVAILITSFSRRTKKTFYRLNVICFLQGINPYRAVTFSTTVIKTNQLMTYKAKAAVCSEIRSKHSTQSEHHVEFWNVKPGGT